jgi:hypothetical protein
MKATSITLLDDDIRPKEDETRADCAIREAKAWFRCYYPNVPIFGAGISHIYPNDRKIIVLLTWV